MKIEFSIHTMSRKLKISKAEIGVKHLTASTVEELNDTIKSCTLKSIIYKDRYFIVKIKEINS